MKNSISNISFLNHDLKNNIGAAISFIQLIELNHPEFEGDECIHAISEALSRAYELTEKIAVASKSDLEEKDNNTELVKIAVKEHAFSNVEPAYEQLRKLYPQLIINDSYKALDEEKYILLNVKALTLFRENIISNAVNAGATVLDIKHEMQNHCVIITYSDNGKGMTEEEIQNIMLSQHGDGTFNGIGTKSILKVAAEHSVYLSYSSELGKGTTIKAILPYVKE